MKRTGVARTPLWEKVDAQLAGLKRMPALIQSFFDAPGVAYITNW